MVHRGCIKFFVCLIIVGDCVIRLFIPASYLLEKQKLDMWGRLRDWRFWVWDNLFDGTGLAPKRKKLRLKWNWYVLLLKFEIWLVTIFVSRHHGYNLWLFWGGVNVKKKAVGKRATFMLNFLVLNFWKNTIFLPFPKFHLMIWLWDICGARIRLSLLDNVIKLQENL